jgi:hypothetical protein
MLMLPYGLCYVLDAHLLASGLEDVECVLCPAVVCSERFGVLTEKF